MLKPRLHVQSYFNFLMYLPNRTDLNSCILFELCTHSLEQSSRNCGRSGQMNIFFALRETESRFTAAPTPLPFLIDSTDSVAARMGNIRALLQLMAAGRSTHVKMDVF